MPLVAKKAEWPQAAHTSSCETASGYRVLMLRCTTPQGQFTLQTMLQLEDNVDELELGNTLQ